MLPTFCNQVVTRIRPGTKSSRGSDLPDWSKADELDIKGCSVQPAATSLTQDGRVLGVLESAEIFFLVPSIELSLLIV